VDPASVADSRSVTAWLVGPVFCTRFVGSDDGWLDGVEEG
jgi:hypothetical protein